MGAREVLMPIIQQIAYIDFENDTDVASELAVVISHAVSEGLDAEEITELVLPFINDEDTDDEQADFIRQLISLLPSALKR